MQQLQNRGSSLYETILMVSSGLILYKYKS